MKDKKKVIISSAIVSFLLLLALVIYFIVSSKSPEGQIENLKEAILEENVTELKDVVRTNGDKISDEDAKRMITYVHQHKKQFNKDIDAIKKNIHNKNFNDTKLGVLKDQKGKPFLTVSKDGIQFFFLKKLSFTPNYQDVYVKESYSQNTTYSYINKGQRQEVIISNKATKLGEFMVGDYDLNVTKRFDDLKLDINKTIDGTVHINTDNLNAEGDIVAESAFPQSWFKVELQNTNDLDKDFTLYVNDSKLSYDKDKVYGKYPNDSILSIKATGTINNRAINTDVADVKPNTNNSAQVIKLRFKDDDIKKQKESEKKVKKLAESFIEEYTTELTFGYKSSAFDNLKAFFDNPDSNVAQNIKVQVEDKKYRDREYNEPKLISYKRNKNKVEVIISKKDNKKRTIKSLYTLNYDEAKEEFKIVDYTDI
ncbi:hypothetical protein Q0P22_13660 [Staphylococcus aureus]|nr:hypothetical protein [Staphylococcus aureus]MDN8977669.1 hypothetical protein [Staphylococcus aureus]